MNMSYCRFENTYNDLVDCSEHLEDTDLSNLEQEYRDRLIKLCQKISEDYSNV